MNDHLIRIELHGTHDYTELHNQARARGMVRTIPGSDGSIYELPTGTYFYRGDGRARDVRALALQAAAAAGHPNAAVVVAEAKLIAWEGLSIVRKAA